MNEEYRILSDEPLLTQHAHERCKEMGISPLVPIEILENATVVRPSRGTARHSQGRLLAISERHPAYAVVYAPKNPPEIITVVFRETEEYVRRGTTYSLKETSER